jgi:hypothetical protein
VKRDDGYLLDNQNVEAGIRFDALAELFDPWTFRHIEDLGIGAGWRCREIGAGGPSVPRWLADRVGGKGRVPATDIDVSWARQASGPVAETDRHLAAIAAGHVDLATAPMNSAWGRRPDAAD